MPFDAIFFDAGNTLIFINPRVLVPVIREHVADVDEEGLRKAEFFSRTRLTRRVEQGDFGPEYQNWKEYL